MKLSVTLWLIVVILFGAGYWYYQVEAVCDIPIAYQVGIIDERFDLTTEEARAAISAAESLWEDATGKNLFTYDEESDFYVNFIYDTRQAFTDAEGEFREGLDVQESMSDAIRAQYESVLADYEDLRASYETQSAAYEEKLQRYNAEVEHWNKKGGAPESTFNELATQKEELSSEQKRLNDIAYELNQLISQMNKLAQKGNIVVSNYNTAVEQYNKQFAEEREFTQGDYQGDRINIYQYDSPEELIIVLAHEFGHALSLDHVEGETSIMYHLMGAQTQDQGLSPEDVAAFRNICGENDFSWWSLF